MNSGESSIGPCEAGIRDKVLSKVTEDIQQQLMHINSVILDMNKDLENFISHFFGKEANISRELNETTSCDADAGWFYITKDITLQITRNSDITKSAISRLTEEI